jgi:hypothetical protein
VRGERWRMGDGGGAAAGHGAIPGVVADQGKWLAGSG